MTELVAQAIELLTLLGQLGFVAAAWKLARKVDARQTAHEIRHEEHAKHIAQDTVFQQEVREYMRMVH